MLFFCVSHSRRTYHLRPSEVYKGLGEGRDTEWWKLMPMHQICLNVECPCNIFRLMCRNLNDSHMRGDAQYHGASSVDALLHPAPRPAEELPLVLLSAHGESSRSCRTASSFGHLVSEESRDLTVRNHDLVISQ